MSGSSDTAAALSADQIGLGDEGRDLWEQVLMEGSMFTAAPHLHSLDQYGCRQQEPARLNSLWSCFQHEAALLSYSLIIGLSLCFIHSFYLIYFFVSFSGFAIKSLPSY